MAIIEPKTVTLKNGQNVCIRTAGEADIQGVLDYTAAIFRDDRFFLTTAKEAKDWWDEEKTRERIASTEENANAISVITDFQGQVVSMSHAATGRKY